MAVIIEDRANCPWKLYIKHSFQDIKQLVRNYTGVLAYIPNEGKALSKP